MGFWKAIKQVYPKTREQRCWVHKTANVLDKLPKRLQAEAKQKLHDIWMADTREHANQAFDLFRKTCEAKYPKAVECLTKDREVLLAFYDFPAEHWIHLRTTKQEAIFIASSVGQRLSASAEKSEFNRKADLFSPFRLHDEIPGRG